MLAIAESDIRHRIERDNPWWANAKARIREAEYPKRVYFAPFKKIALNFAVRRAAVLLGPRRVGKTVMAKQLIHDAIKGGMRPKNIMYTSIDAPVYAGIALEKFLSFFPDPEENDEDYLVIFDEIQYFRDWEVHLKDLVDNYPNVKFVATGSAAAALRLKSKESGAGRFSDFMLPPLTFYEFLNFTGDDEKLVEQTGSNSYLARDISALNSKFVDYLNFGGYPEAVLNEEIRDNSEQFIRNDIIDKVLLKDLPSLYGINEIRDLNKLFSFLAYNAGSEASLEKISRESGLTKPTIKKYIEYLESAFLIIKLSTIDDNCRSMERERNFKIYLNNPSMRAALFTPAQEGETEKIGHLVECAIFSQWQHSASFRQLRYARWRNEGEVDIVCLHPGDDRPAWIGEIKWSDRVKQRPWEEARHMSTLLKKHPSIKTAFITSKTVNSKFQVDGRNINVRPSSLYCYTLGKNITRKLNIVDDDESEASE
ncbi:ATP-binding protein [Methylobacterium brachiatum]